jgi:two-component system CheB/CheR fusion protein
MATDQHKPSLSGAEISEDSSSRSQLEAGTGEASREVASDEPGTFPVVGVGASAGGLAAFEAFFSGMPTESDPGMAFVLVQHLAPDHESLLSELVQRYTRLRVHDVEDGSVVQPNRAYIIPPNRDMAYLNGTLQLLESTQPRGQRLPIDYFFRSLAQGLGERAIGVVLSGTGSDGTMGARAIKGEGGMVMVQAPETAEHDGMPRSALKSGVVDYELPPEEMVPQLIAYTEHAIGRLSIATPSSVVPESALAKILVILRAQTGHDFSLYKPSTVERRVARRMVVHQIETVDAYVRYLQRYPPEAHELHRELLIGVTSFFRDSEAFAVLEESAIPQIVASKPAEGHVRVWVPGCSTGEEAYSIAILLAESQEARQREPRIQVFATDLDAEAIATARAGVYPASLVADVAEERLTRFFVAEPGGAPDSGPSSYRIKKAIRDTVVFSEQDVISDPPFSRLDLISCRNLLIYMRPALQRKLIALFHYALRPGGLLFLGTSESVGEHGELFATVDRVAKLYQRRDRDSGYTWELFAGTSSQSQSARRRIEAHSPDRSQSHAEPHRQLTERTLLNRVVPVAVLVNGEGSILYVHGRSGMFLELKPGAAGANNVLEMVRPALERDLATTFHRAQQTLRIERRDGLRLDTNGEPEFASLVVCPALREGVGPPDEPLYVIAFEHASRPSEAPLVAPTSDRSPLLAGAEELSPEDAAREIMALRERLRVKEEFLQSTTEELEVSNEELKSSNEELQSINEELQSTNEELETSKEELQSVNEELTTVNAELETKLAELTRANNDMNNLLAGTGIATLFLDTSLRIMRYTPAATKIINLIETDIGRPVAHILSNLRSYDQLVGDTQEVLDTLVHKALEVQSVEGTSYRMYIRPYRTLENVVEGAVLTFVELGQTEADEGRSGACGAGPMARDDGGGGDGRG